MRRFLVCTTQILVIFLAILGLSVAYDVHFGDGQATTGVITPLPYSLYAMEIISFILTAVLLVALRRKYKFAALPWIACGAVGAGLFIYWWTTLHWMRSDPGSIIEFLQYALGGHNYDRTDPSLESMWPTFWRFQIPFALTFFLSYASLIAGRVLNKKSRSSQTING